VPPARGNPAASGTGSPSPPRRQPAGQRPPPAEGTGPVVAAAPPGPTLPLLPGQATCAPSRVAGGGVAAGGRQAASRWWGQAAGTATAADGGGLYRAAPATYSFSAMISAGRERASACAGPT